MEEQSLIFLVPSSPEVECLFLYPSPSPPIGSLSNAFEVD